MTYMRTYGHYRRRMKQIVTEMQEAIGDGEVWEDNADDYGWHLTLGDGSDPTAEDGLDVSLMLEDAEEFEGDDGKGQGTFSIRAVRFGGEVLAHFAPGNFTQDVWTQLSRGNYPELDMRLAIIAEVAPQIAEIVRKDRKGEDSG